MSDVSSKGSNDDVSAELDDLQGQIEEVREILTRLLKDYIPPISERVRLLEVRAESLEENLDSLRERTFGPGITRAERIKYPRNYEDYEKVLSLVDQGMSVNRTAKVLGLPYSTCYSYTTMTAEQVARLKTFMPRRAASLPDMPRESASRLRDGAFGDPGSDGRTSGS